jgi:protein involved in polysaccharide export with SLBB domain
MRKILIILFLFLSLFQLHSQTKQDAISEANRLKISSKQDAINALNSKGINESQVREIAKLRGIDYDTALAQYLNSKASSTNTAVASSNSNEVVSELKVDSLTPFAATPLKDPAVTEKEAIGYFGYDIFINNPFGQKEYLVGNIDEGYILAPGDELRITVFGDNNLEFVSKIDLNGNISFPNLGVFFAAGNSFATLKNRLKIFLGKYYSGLLSTPTRTFLDVSLTQIRPVKVSVLGNVNTPGPHLVNGMATVLNALYASGGIATSGTLRDVKVYRNNKIIKTIDLYDYITQGNIDQDIRLSNNDVLFVGPRLSSVTLSGKVKKSAIYELKLNESLKDLFKYSGGLPADASLNNVNIFRIKPFKERDQELVFDRFLTTVNFASIQNSTKNKFQLTDGDQVTVQQILEKQRNEVSIQGNVQAPGTFALDVFQDLKKLITIGAKGVLPNTYLQKVDINKVDQQGNLSFKTYNLSSILSGDVVVSLEENDTIKIYSLQEIEGEQKVSISGFGVADKTVFLRENQSLFDLIFESVSYDELEFQSKVLSSRLDLKRFDPATGLYSLTQFSLDDLMTLKTTYLQAKDQIVLYTKAVIQNLNPTFKVIGKVKLPGEFELLEGMYLEDAILTAGGFLEIAEKSFVNISRLNRNLEEGTYSKRTVNDIDVDYLLGLKKTPSNPFVLQAYDVISVVAPIRPNFQPMISVQGEVKYPGAVFMESDIFKISEIIDVVGGYTNNYNHESSFVEREGLKLFLNPKGQKFDSNIILQDGDVLVIGSKLSPIKTTGAVLNPTVFNWQEGKRAKYYIRKSGGKKKRIESVTVQSADGSSKKVSFFSNPKIYPGSVIDVVEKPEKVNGDPNKFIDDFTRIFSLITGTLTAILLVTKL